MMLIRRNVKNNYCPRVVNRNLNIFFQRLYKSCDGRRISGISDHVIDMDAFVILRTKPACISKVGSRVLLSYRFDRG